MRVLPFPRLLSRAVITLMYERDIFASVPCIVPRVACRVQNLSEDAVEVLQQVCPVGVEETKQRLKRGDRCYVARVDGKAAHFSWVQTTGWHYVLSAGLWRNIGKGEVWIYHCHTAEWCRGQRIYPFVLTEILKDFRQEGIFLKAIIYTTQDNRASQRGILRAGFSLKRKHRALRVRGVHIPLPGLSTVLHSEDTVDYTFSFSKATRETLRRFGKQAGSKRSLRLTDEQGSGDLNDEDRLYRSAF